MTTIAELAEATTTPASASTPMVAGGDFDEEYKKVEGHLGHTSRLVEALPVELYPEYVEIKLSDTVSKKVSYSDFKDMLGRISSDIRNLTLTGMLLPSNVFFIGNGDRKMFISSYYPGGSREMIYGKKKITIAAPNIIISHTLRKDGEDWSVENSCYFCTDLPVSKLPQTFISEVSHKDGVYLLPMSNTYSEGRMCYGQNTMPSRYKAGNLRGLDYYYKFLWDTPFNNDLGIKAVPSVGVSTWYGILAAAAAAGKEFPYSKLYGYKGAPREADDGIREQDVGDGRI